MIFQSTTIESKKKLLKMHIFLNLMTILVKTELKGDELNRALSKSKNDVAKDFLFKFSRIKVRFLSHIIYLIISVYARCILLRCLNNLKIKILQIFCNKMKSDLVWFRKIVVSWHPKSRFKIQKMSTYTQIHYHSIKFYLSTV